MKKRREEKRRRGGRGTRELQTGRKGWAAKGFNEDERDKPTSGSVSLHPSPFPSLTPFTLTPLLLSRLLQPFFSHLFPAFSHSSMGRNVSPLKYLSFVSLVYRYDSFLLSLRNDKG